MAINCPMQPNKKPNNTVLGEESHRLQRNQQLAGHQVKIFSEIPRKDSVSSATNIRTPLMRDNRYTAKDKDFTLKYR